MSKETGAKREEARWCRHVIRQQELLPKGGGGGVCGGGGGGVCVCVY